MVLCGFALLLPLLSKVLFRFGSDSLPPAIENTILAQIPCLCQPRASHVLYLLVRSTILGQICCACHQLMLLDARGRHPLGARAGSILGIACSYSKAVRKTCLTCTKLSTSVSVADLRRFAIKRPRRGTAFGHQRAGLCPKAIRCCSLSVNCLVVLCCRLYSYGRKTMQKCVRTIAPRDYSNKDNNDDRCCCNGYCNEQQTLNNDIDMFVIVVIVVIVINNHVVIIDILTNNQTVAMTIWISNHSVMLSV